MNLFSEKLIQRPVLSWVISIVLVMLGLVAFRQIPLRQYPQVEYPVITIIGTYAGADPDIIEAQLTRPFEEAVAGLEGLDFTLSTSSPEESKVKLFIKGSRSIDAAAADVHNLLSSRLDPEKMPAKYKVMKANADAEPVVYVVLYGDSFSPSRLQDYAKRYLENEFSVIPGVASVDVTGGAAYEMHVVLDPVRLASFRLTAEDVVEALGRQNVKKPAGRLTTLDKEIQVTTSASLRSTDDFDNLIITQRDGYVIRVSDVGKTVLNEEDSRFKVRFRGKNAVMLGVISQARANPIEISKFAHKQLEKIRQNLPKGMHAEIASDRSVFIEKSIDQVYRTLIEAIVLVVLVVFLFLRSARASLIPLITIPISLVASFFIMYLLGFSLNILTLLAFVLAIGLVVDDAIVVLENIYRYIEEGMPAMQAALKGTREIQFSVIAMTLTLAAVYAPIAMATGVTGKLFTEFSLTLAGAVLVSGIVALTLSPMMCSRILKAHTPDKESAWGRLDIGIGNFLDLLDEKYGKVLSTLVRFPKFVLGCAAALGLLGYLTFRILPTELAPREDQGTLQVYTNSPFGASVGYIDRYMTQAEKILAKVKEIDNSLSVIQAGGDSYILNQLIPWKDRKLCEAILPALRDDLDEISGIQTTAFCPSRSLMGGSSERPFQIAVQTSGRSIQEIVEVAKKVDRFLRQYPGLRFVEWDLPAQGKSYSIVINKDRAAAMGIDPSRVAAILDTLIAGRRHTTFEKEGKLYPVRVWMKEIYRHDPEDVLSLMVRGQKNNRDVMVPLIDIASFEERTATPAIMRYNGMRSVTFKAGIEPGKGLLETYAAVKRDIAEVLPNGYRITEVGELKRLIEEGNTLVLIFGLALTFIFLVMAAQFESFRDPFIIILSVPLALTGAILTLFVVPQGSMNVYSQIGLVTLIGLITKHAILIVDFANKLHAEGKALQEAIVEACRLRLRPILMTTLAMVLGAVPLALSSGPGFEARRQIGWVIVGGMTLGTLFTLLILPSFYTTLASRQKKRLKAP